MSVEICQYLRVIVISFASLKLLHTYTAHRSDLSSFVVGLRFGFSQSLSDQEKEVKASCSSANADF